MSDNTGKIFTIEEESRIKEISRHVAEEVSEKYLNSIKLALRDLRSGISEDVAEVVSPITNKFFDITDGLRATVDKLTVFAWVMGVVTAGIILYILFS